MTTSMEIEILEQPKIIGSITRQYFENYVVKLDMPLSAGRIKIIASGSSYNASLIAREFFEDITGLETTVDYSSEFITNKNLKILPDTLYFFASQSGETFDTLEAAKKVKEAGAMTYAVVNNDSSSLYNLCDYKVNIISGVENSIAATKSFSATIIVLYLCAAKLGQNMLKKVDKFLKNVPNIEKDIENTLDLVTDLDKAAEFLSKYGAFPIIGSGINYALCREGALKIKETSYIDVNACAMGEFVHGHVAILNKIDTLIEVVMQNATELEKKTIERIYNDYNPKSVVITNSKEDFGQKISVVFPDKKDKIINILNAVFVLQMLALKIALILKRNVDRPKGLNKVVK